MNLRRLQILHLSPVANSTRIISNLSGYKPHTYGRVINPIAISLSAVILSVLMSTQRRTVNLMWLAAPMTGSRQTRECRSNLHVDKDGWWNGFTLRLSADLRFNPSDHPFTLSGNLKPGHRDGAAFKKSDRHRIPCWKKLGPKVLTLAGKFDGTGPGYCT